MLGIGDVDDMEGRKRTGDENALAVWRKGNVEDGMLEGTERGHVDAIVRPQIDLATVGGRD